MHHPLLKKTILFLYTALITLLSVVPPSNIPKIDVIPYIDKWVHLGMYAGLSFLWLWVWKQKTNHYKYWIILLIVFGWGTLMEIIQGITHLGRNFEIADILVDVLGFLPGLFAWKIIQNSKFQALIDP